MAVPRSRPGPLGVAAVSLAVALALWRWIDSGPEPKAEPLSGSESASSASRAPVDDSDERGQPSAAYGRQDGLSPFMLWARGRRNSVRARSATGAAAADSVYSAPDLRRVFDDNIDSDDPRQRRTAARAFDACVPAFLPGAGGSASPEALIDALPADQRAEREAAYRSLFARCHRLLATSRNALGETLQTLRSEPQTQAPGQRAQEALLAGRLSDTELIVGEALSESDPASVASLAGIAARIARMRQPDGIDAALLQRAQEIDAALPAVACDLGLDCSPQSLWALQLCATEGLCEGDVLTRLMARNSPGTVDPDAVQQQRVRLVGLIRSNRALGTADLLPQ